MNEVTHSLNQQGAVAIWSESRQPEMDIGYVAGQMTWQPSHVGLRLILVGYNGPWRNSLYDADDQCEVYLNVHYISGHRKDFSYIGERIPGRNIGDVSAAEGKESEWYEIHVLRSPGRLSDYDKAEATWKCVAPLT